MGKLVNLNHARKARDRQAAAETAAANRVKHGRTRAEKQADQAAEARRNALLDGARRPEPPLDEGGGKG
ncbi:DUF4169 family protein [Falsiroseomonas selenitidurans]|uniref:DUF4169 family protein n=1 Tax=Falsiroseomonas selenitidurans TaxID=2716335 RepID=A0ABX1E839_9PROT|nr:DUF4169 family protein [Falsiroseomonas selenitidurans]NKC31973.1 DUF4169 family protein [Falsiroseomonas selenitidurans]OYW08169.1 MAG: hypothetical protein B7Z53_05195 [Rhodospirillales bacterium 12-71-4]